MRDYSQEQAWAYFGYVLVIDREQRTENQKQETDRHQTENRQRTDKSERRNNTSVTSSEPSLLPPSLSHPLTLAINILILMKMNFALLLGYSCYYEFTQESPEKEKKGVETPGSIMQLDHKCLLMYLY